MPIGHSRRKFLAGLSVAGAVGVLGTRRSLADEPPPEVTTLRLRRDSPGPGYICYAPEYVAEELLRAEGFTDIRYIFVPAGLPSAQAYARGELDFAQFIVIGTPPSVWMPACRLRCWRVCIPAVSSCSCTGPSKPSPT